MPKFPGGSIETILVGCDPDSSYTYPVQEATFNLAEQTIDGNARHGGQTTLADVRAPAYYKKEDVTLNRQAVSFVDAGDLDHLARSLMLEEETSLAGLQRKYEADAERGVSIPTDSYLAFLQTLKQNPGALNRLLLAQCLGANLVLGDFEGTSEVPTFGEVKPMTDIGPYDDESRKFTRNGATLTVSASKAMVTVARVNEPCSVPGKLIEAVYGTADDVPRAKKFVVEGQGRRGYVGMIVKGGAMAVGQRIRYVPFGQRQ